MQPDPQTAALPPPVEYPYENDEDCTAKHPTIAEILGLDEYLDEGPE